MIQGDHVMTWENRPYTEPRSDMCAEQHRNESDRATTIW